MEGFEEVHEQARKQIIGIAAILGLIILLLSLGLFSWWLVLC